MDGTNREEQGDEEWKEGIDIVCTKCGYSLDHYAYKIFDHPIVRFSALCMLCNDEARDFLQNQDSYHEDLMDTADNHKDGVDSTSDGSAQRQLIDSDGSQVCTWCFAGGDLVLCSAEEDGKKCPHAFCRDCLERYLGEEYVQEKVDIQEHWYCLVCEALPVRKRFEAAIIAAKQASIYEFASPRVGMTEEEEIDEEEERGENEGREEYNPDEENALQVLRRKAEADISRMRVLAQESEDAGTKLEEDRVDAFRQEVRAEMLAHEAEAPSSPCLGPWTSSAAAAGVRENEPEKSVEDRVEEEVRDYISKWDRHLRLLQRQEAELDERISTKYGLDMSKIPENDYIQHSRSSISLSNQPSEAALERQRQRVTAERKRERGEGLRENDGKRKKR